MGCIQACAGRGKDEEGLPPPAQFPQFSSRLAQSTSTDNVSRASGRRKKSRGNSSRNGITASGGSAGGPTPADALAHPTKKSGKHKKAVKCHPDNSNGTPEGEVVPTRKKKSSKKKKKKGKAKGRGVSPAPSADTSSPATPQPKAAAATLFDVTDAPAPLPAPPLPPARTPTDLADLSLRQRQLVQYFWNHAMHTASVVPPLYSRIGGSAAVQAAVDLFYTKVLADTRVNGFFEGVGMERQKQMLATFLTVAFGGPNNYTGKNLRDGHRHLVKQGLNDSHFDTIIGHLGATLTELSVPSELIGEAAAIAESVRSDVLCKDEPPATENEPLFNRLGGPAVVQDAVDLFYTKVLADGQINGFFEGIGMNQQRQRLARFLTVAFGGSSSYSGRTLRDAHRHLVKQGLNDSHFDAIIGHLGATLTELSVPSELIGEAAAIAESVRSDVLCKDEPPAAPAADKESLFDRIGGSAAVQAAVDLFYTKVLADVQIGGFFEGVGMDRQKEMLATFLTVAFGGPNIYSGRTLRDTHRHLVKQGLNDSHFDTIIGHLGATLTELSVPSELIGEAAAIAESVRSDVLCKGEPSVEEKAALFDRIGGSAAIQAAVDLFYTKVLADTRVNGFFEGVGMERQKQMLATFLTVAFGGPNNYTGKNLRDSHRHLVKQGLNDSHFDTIIGHLGATLAELSVPSELIGEAAAIAESVRSDVLCKDEPPAAPAADKESLFDRIGGSAAVQAAVDLFYTKVLADTRVNGFFEGVGMERQKQMLATFLTVAFGGPNNYTGKNLRDGHRHLVKQGLNDSHFAAVMELLGETLTELGVPEPLIKEAASVAASVKNDVLCKPAFFAQFAASNASIGLLLDGQDFAALDRLLFASLSEVIKLVHEGRAHQANQVLLKLGPAHRQYGVRPHHLTHFRTELHAWLSAACRGDGDGSVEWDKHAAAAWEAFLTCAAEQVSRGLTKADPGAVNAGKNPLDPACNPAVPAARRVYMLPTSTLAAWCASWDLAGPAVVRQALADGIEKGRTASGTVSGEPKAALVGILGEHPTAAWAVFDALCVMQREVALLESGTSNGGSRGATGGDGGGATKDTFPLISEAVGVLRAAVRDEDTYRACTAYIDGVVRAQLKVRYSTEVCTIWALWWDLTWSCVSPSASSPIVSSPGISGQTLHSSLNSDVRRPPPPRKGTTDELNRSGCSTASGSMNKFVKAKPGGKGSTVFNEGIVAGHNSRASCWLIIEDEKSSKKKCYDVTPFLSKHPGGVSVILKYAGKNATKEFTRVHSPVAWGKLSVCKISLLPPPPPSRIPILPRLRGGLLTKRMEKKAKWSHRNHSIIDPPPPPPQQEFYCGDVE